MLNYLCYFEYVCIMQCAIKFLHIHPIILWAVICFTQSPTPLVYGYIPLFPSNINGMDVYVLTRP